MAAEKAHAGGQLSEMTALATNVSSIMRAILSRIRSARMSMPGCKVAGGATSRARNTPQAERDLGTKLDWVGVDHWNTDNPHIHVIVRGKGDDGRDLVIARDYIGQG